MFEGITKEISDEVFEVFSEKNQEELSEEFPEVSFEIFSWRISTGIPLKLISGKIKSVEFTENCWNKNFVEFLKKNHSKYHKKYEDKSTVQQK